MYGSESVTDLERTAFRKAEKKYKLYYDQTKKYHIHFTCFFVSFRMFIAIVTISDVDFIIFRKKQPRPVDLSEVIDFKSILESHNRKDELPPQVFALESDFDQPVFCLKKHPGMYNNVSFSSRVFEI